MINTIFKTKSFFLLSFATLLYFSAFSIQSAKASTAEPELHFYPASGWDMKRIERDGRTICSLAAQMNNGFVLQISGSNQIVNTLNFDFKQSLFQDIEGLEAILNVPGKMRRSVQAKPLTDSLLSITTTPMQNLVVAMRESNVIDLHVGANAFRFFLTGLAQKIDGFDRCLGIQDTKTMAAIQQEKKMEPPRDAPSERLQKIAENAQKKYEAEMAQILTQAPERDDEARISMSAQDEGADDNTLTVSARDAASVRPSPRGERFTERLAREMANADSFGIESDFEMPKASSGEPVQEVSAPETQSAEAEKVDLPPLEPVELDQSAKEQAKAQIAEAETLAPEEMPAPETVEPEPVMEQMEKQPKTRSIRSPEVKITKQTASIEADFTDFGLPEESVETPKAVAPMPIGSEPFSRFENREDSKLQKEVNTLRAENIQLNAELEKALRASEKERLDVSSDNWNLEQATMRFNEAERQIAALGQKIQKERAQCAMEKSELEMMLFDPAVTEQAQLARLADLEKQLQAAKAEIQKLRGGASN